MVIRKLLQPDILLGYTSLVAVILFIGGMIMLLLGVLGEYIGRIYICMNKAPQYVIKGITDNREG
jgi:undecaprenyl-phosphate 4-deoxy-4-formamido-L-arabinose transferase